MLLLLTRSPVPCEFGVSGHSPNNGLMYRIQLLLVSLVLPFGGLALAQPTNVEVLGNLAVECLGDVPGSVKVFRLNQGDRMPYLRPFLTRYWLSKGYTVLLEDSVGSNRDRLVHEMRYDPQSAMVTYQLAARDSLARSVDLSISHSFISPDGVLIDEARCRETYGDAIMASDVDRLQSDPWEETRAVVPLDRGWRTWAEPAAIGTSIGVVVYLFFSLRS